MGKALRRAFASRPFLIAVVIMLVTAFGMGAATSFLKLNSARARGAAAAAGKGAAQLGHWMQVSDDEPLEADIEQTLGTKT